MKNKKEDKTEKNKKADAKETKIEELQEQTEQLKQEKDEMFAKFQRVVADYDNYQKRAPKQIADSVRYEKEKIIKSLLPMLDNFEHTLAGAESAESIEDLLKGVRIVYDQACDVLKSHDVETINALGEKFDPSLHQAMMRKQDAEYEDNIVIEEFQKGYKLGGRVIRPSKVIVNKLPEEEEEKPQEEQQPEEQQQEEEKQQESQQPEEQQQPETDEQVESED